MRLIIYGEDHDQAIQGVLNKFGVNTDLISTKIQSFLVDNRIESVIAKKIKSLPQDLSEDYDKLITVVCTELVMQNLYEKEILLESYLKNVDTKVLNNLIANLENTV